MRKSVATRRNTQTGSNDSADSDTVGATTVLVHQTGILLKSTRSKHSTLSPRARCVFVVFVVVSVCCVCVSVCMLRTVPADLAVIFTLNGLVRNFIKLLPVCRATSNYE